ncbi:MAG TPA: tRNA 2-selenouridine(34) synthase MnmH [Flavisolibacter sp.]|jgi:tRNA 2-selenouridine synthase|nr:tRNA 2-selenouridine(34) synthase MnmH [Flavisolibacter sp.]
MRRVAINEFLAASRNALVIDVRSPSEYRHAHLPGAVNLPLFSDEERAVVGTRYKQVSREAAIKIGLDYFGPKMRLMVEEVERLVRSRQYAVSSPGADTLTADCLMPTANSVFLYCWRGGMRSGAVAWLLNLYGFNVTALAGGYKAFRNWVLQTNAYPYRLKLIGGYTGSGKTAILKTLEQKGELIVDLEALARHKGSAFGNIGMPQQPSQEMFENFLALTIADRHAKAAFTPAEGADDLPQKAIWIEDESQRIGHVNIPQPFWQNMRRSPLYFLDIPFEERLQNIVAEYGNLDRERMVAAIERIARRLGPLETKSAIRFLQEGFITESFRILLYYYDKQYRKGLYNRENLSSLLTNITCEKVSVANAVLLSQAQLVS